MKPNRVVPTAVMAFSLGMSAQTAFAQSAGELTAVGAEKGANKDNSIPAWGGVEKPTGAWAFGKYRGDFWKHKAEKPLFVIDASNVDKHADKLTPGQVHLIKTNKGYSMPIYPSHRTCGLPDAVLANTAKNAAGKARIGANGWSLEDAALPGVPFPQPKSGVEAVWNFLMRYQGVAVEFPALWTAVSPVPGSEKGIATNAAQFFYYPWAAKGTHSPKDDGGIQGAVYYAFNQPAGLAGQAIVQRLFFDKDNEAFYYFPGQRRVRRLPSYSYDAPLIGFENQYPVDQSFVFFGLPDRFDWKIAGKKEIYIPYNNFQTAKFDVPLSDALKPTFVSPDVRRYELHRVWEIVGTVKPGVRHASPKKTLYLDEDSWIAAAGDDYDAQGKLWRTKENNIVPLWEVSACASFMQQNFYDFASGRYVADGVQHGTQKGSRAYGEGEDPRMKLNFYTAETLRANSER
jgi:hypothetical protein